VTARPLLACGIVPFGSLLQLAIVEQRLGAASGALDALTFEPGRAEAVRRELAVLAPAAVACGFRLPPPGPAAVGERLCDRQLAKVGIRPNPQLPAGAERDWVTAVADLARLEQGAEGARAGAGEAYRGFLCETVPDAVFARLLGARVPARRHPFGVRARIEALGHAAVRFRGGSPWDRRIEEIEAVACALCAFEALADNAIELGDRSEGVVVLPGREALAAFDQRALVPVVERLLLH